MRRGFFDRVWCAVEDAAGEIRSGATTPLHHAFSEHLLKVASALYQYKLLANGDIANGEEEVSIRACLPADAELRQAIDDAIKARDELTRAIEEAKG